jgi:hypothetical protein
MPGLRALQIKNDQEETIQQQTINSVVAGNVKQFSCSHESTAKQTHPGTITLSHLA